MRIPPQSVSRWYCAKGTCWIFVINYDLRWYYYAHGNLTMVFIRIAGRAHLRQSVLRLEEALRLQLSSKLISRAAPLAAVLRRAHSRWVVSPLSGNTVRCRYYAVDFLQNLHKRNPVARPSGWAMGCTLWIQILIHILLQTLQWCIQYHAIFDRVITGTRLYHVDACS